jgi:hypothetical protein
MNIIIQHFEPDSLTPYDVEEYNNIDSFHWDSQTKELSFVDADGFLFQAKYAHRVYISISTEG